MLDHVTSIDNAGHSLADQLFRTARPLVVCASVIVIEHRQRQDFTRLASYSARFTSAMGRFVRVGARPTSSYD